MLVNLILLASAPTGGFVIGSWVEVGALLVAMSTVTGVVVALLGALSTRKREAARELGEKARLALTVASSDDEAATRLITLIQAEAEKRVEIARLEFQAQLKMLEAKHAERLAEMQRRHAAEMQSLRAEFFDRLMKSDNRSIARASALAEKIDGT